MKPQDIYLLNQAFAVALYFLPALLFVGSWKLIVYIVSIVRRSKDKSLLTLEECRERVLRLEDEGKAKDKQLRALRAKIGIYERQIKAVNAALEV